MGVDGDGPAYRDHGPPSPPNVPAKPLAWHAVINHDPDGLFVNEELSAYNGMMEPTMTTSTSSASSQQAALNITGMDCASCVAHVEKAARGVKGVDACQVNLARGRAVIDYDPAKTSPDEVAKAIHRSGYRAEVDSSGANSADAEKKRMGHQQAHAKSWLNRAIVGMILWLPMELLHWMSTAGWLGHTAWMTWAMLATGTISIVYVGWGFYVGAIKGLLRRTTNMDTLIAMGASVAYGYSLVVFIGIMRLGWDAHNLPLYFTESSGLLALISLGHYLEARARSSAGSAIGQLLQLAPQMALRVNRKPDTKNLSQSPLVGQRPSEMPDVSSLAELDVKEVPLAELATGDWFIVKPGQRIATDGKVLQGRSTVDESMITGEPLPPTRKSGDAVVGGTMNIDGWLLVQATHVGSQTALAQIVQLVESAQSSKPPVQKLADQIAAVFVPAVLGVALITAIGWFFWGRAQGWESSITYARMANAVCSVLIIACPCALGLAVPAALMVGLGRGAKRGILIRDIDALQHAEKLTTVVMDKTGTITMGRPRVAKILCISDISEADLLRLAGSAEQYSEHPLARAITELAQKKLGRLDDPEEFTNESGYGVVATINNQNLLIGSNALLSKHGEVTSGYPAQHGSGKSLVHVGRKLANGKVERLGLLVMEDQVKPDSARAIATLRRMKLQTVLLTGDNRATAAAVAQETGIDSVFAEVRPEGKARTIVQLQSEGKKVAMVGDGINDAPALAAADLGIAIGSGSDIAKETGGIVLVSGSLTGIATAIRLSRATMRKIRQNLFLAFIYNVIAIPLAATGYLSPLIAAGAMALSDISVIGNALSLRRTRIDDDAVAEPTKEKEA